MIINNKMQKKIENKTSWGKVAPWYNELLEKEGTYQKDLILPNLLKVMDIKSNDKILDVACGQGFFAHEFAKLGANVSGADISPELIEIAKKNFPEIKFVVAPSDKLNTFTDKSFDKVSIVLALQNISNLPDTIKECSRVLKDNGKLYLVLNHPAFRIPRKSGWGFDEKNKIQYRRIEKYLSENMTNIDMNPGEKNIKNKEYTVSFHRPIQSYVNALSKENLLIKTFGEWASNKKSEKGPRQKTEDIARKEIPMFMCVEAVKINL